MITIKPRLISYVDLFIKQKEIEESERERDGKKRDLEGIKKSYCFFVKSKWSFLNQSNMFPWIHSKHISSHDWLMTSQNRIYSKYICHGFLLGHDTNI